MSFPAQHLLEIYVPFVCRIEARTRYFHIHENDQLDEELVASWIPQASGLPGDRLFFSCVASLAGPAVDPESDRQGRQRRTSALPVPRILLAALWTFPQITEL